MTATGRHYQGRFDRVFAMPNRETFKIRPIRDFLEEETPAEGLGLDPFAGNNSPALITNDINPDCKTDYHLPALEFLRQFHDGSCTYIYIDPPYTGRQIKECYAKLGLTVTMMDTQTARFMRLVKREVVRLLEPGGIAICCGYNTMGIGKTLGFEMYRILDVYHGGGHYDTLVTAERKRGRKPDRRPLSLLV